MPRIIVPAGVYHCMSRVVNGERILGKREKEVFVSMMRKVADFSGVKILTYCVMPNHFHILAKIWPQGDISDGELVRRFEVLYENKDDYNTLTPKNFAKFLEYSRRDRIGMSQEELELAEEGDRLREQYVRRMGNVSEFMKTLKQRYSRWFNQSHRRYGPLWSDRFKSVLVEGGHEALLIVGAYIDLNPVRASIVEDPKDYRFSGYGEAMGRGAGEARDGLCSLLGEKTWEITSRQYRECLFCKGAEAIRGKTVYIDEEQVKKVLQCGGRLPLHVILHTRIRYFTEGVVLGSSAFVKECFDKFRNSYYKKRKRFGISVPVESECYSMGIVRKRFDCL